MRGDRFWSPRSLYNVAQIEQTSIDRCQLLFGLPHKIFSLSQQFLENLFCQKLVPWNLWFFVWKKAANA